MQALDDALIMFWFILLTVALACVVTWLAISTPMNAFERVLLPAVCEVPPTPQAHVECFLARATGRVMRRM